MDNYGAGGVYHADDIWQRGVRNDLISSIALPYGYKAILYANDYASGVSVTYKGTYKNVESLEMQCVNLIDTFGAEWNDIITSVEVKKIGEASEAQGQWQAITTTEAMEYNIKVGMTSTSETNTTEENRSQIDIAMEMGFKFMGAESKISIGSSFMHDIKQSVTSSYTQTLQESITTTCTPEEGTDGGAGLYQWVVGTGELNDSVSVWSRHYICRKGDNFRTEPACPPDHCVDVECTVCDDTWTNAIAGDPANIVPYSSSDSNIFGAAAPLLEDPEELEFEEDLDNGPPMPQQPTGHFVGKEAGHFLGK